MVNSTARNGLTHIKTRYFLVTFRLVQGNLEIYHRPAEKMWAKILTKPLQDRSFREFRVEFINFPFDYENGDSVCEDVVNTTIISKANTCTHTGGTNTCSRSYAESTRAIIKSSVASL